MMFCFDVVDAGCDDVHPVVDALLSKGKAPLPAALLLLASGVTAEEIRAMRNGKWLWSMM